MSFFNFLRGGTGAAAGAMASPFSSMAGTLGSGAGGMLGGAIGGPWGATIGSALGGGLSDWLTGGARPQASPQAPQQSPGQILGNGFSSMIPDQYRNQTIGQMGQGLQNQAGNWMNNFMANRGGGIGSLLSSYNLGGRLAGAAGDYFGNRFNSYAPGLSGSTPGQMAYGAGQYLGGQMGQGNGGMMSAYGQGHLDPIEQIADYQPYMA
jgi:hypothetical protein